MKKEQQNLEETSATEKSTRYVDAQDKQNYSKNKELVKEEAIEGSPLKRIKHNGVWFLALGMTRVTEEFKTKEELVKHEKSNMMNIILNMSIALYNRLEEIKASK